MSWWAVVIEGEEIPDVLGPYRSRVRAQSVADDWNRTNTDRAFLVRMTNDPRTLETS